MNHKICEDSRTKSSELSHQICFVYCLSIDLMSSTESGLKIPTRTHDNFNLSLVQQITPHLENLELLDALIKFTGDGWLIITDDPNKVPALCCLATIMANKFQDEMSLKSGIPIDKIPPLRLTICCGRDMAVQLPDKRKDWVGDSARRAVRASGYCLPNEILIDEPIRYNIFRDFDVEPVDLQQRALQYYPKKVEETFPLYTLGQLKSDILAESQAPEYFTYALSIIGKLKEAAKVAKQVSERLRYQVAGIDIAEEDLLRVLRRYNRLMASLLDYPRVLDLFKSIRAAGLSPDVFTYNTLIDKAPDYETAKTWLDKMLQEGIQPNVVTYSTLIDKAPDYETAKTWLDKMAEHQIQPNVHTYTALFSKDLSNNSADDILEWYLSQKYHPEIPLQAAIAFYRNTSRMDQALRLALDYPHLQAARKLIREHSDEAISYFTTISDQNPGHPNADYALGVTFMELGKKLEAQRHLKKALKLAKHGARKTAILEWLHQIDPEQPHNL
jgi:TPR repeat protein